MSMYDPETSLRQMLDYAREAVDLAQGRTSEDVQNDRLLNLAITRLIEIIGEAATRIREPDRDRYPSIPWRVIIGMRNRLIHGYDTIDADILWLTLNERLPPLIAILETLLARDPDAKSEPFRTPKPD